MATLKTCQGIRYILQVMIINLVAWLAWLSGNAFAQLEFSEAVTGSVSFPDGAIACLGNLAVFCTTLLRGRLYLENGVRDVLATNRGPTLKEMEMGSGLTTCIGQNYGDAQVVMLSPYTSNPNSIGQFMKYVCHSHHVKSILLKSLNLDSARNSKVVTAEPCAYRNDHIYDHICLCIVLWTEEEEIRMMISRRMPGILKPLSDSICLLPCRRCLTNGCHGCNQGVLHANQTEEESKAESKSFRLQSAVVTAALCCDEFHDCKCNVLWTDEEEMRTMDARWIPGTFKRLSRSLCLVPSWDCLRRGCHGLLNTQEDSTAESPQLHAEPEYPQIHVEPAVCEMLDRCLWLPEWSHCICIPLREAGDDEWTKLMIRFMMSKDQVTRDVTVGVSDAMEKHIDRSSAECREEEFINYSAWSLIVPRLMEVLVNIVLTGWLRVDGFSSGLIARRVVRDYLVDGKGTGFCANAFLISALIQCNKSSVCQGLRFRGNIVSVRTLSYVVGSVNLICSISWGVLIACEGRFAIHSMPPSTHTLLVMLAFVAVALLLDFPLLNYFVGLIKFIGFPHMREEILQIIIFLGGVLLEIVYIVLGTVMVVKGIDIGKWVYGAFQVLIWIKWGIGSYLLSDCTDRMEMRLENSFRVTAVYSSAFMLNAVLAGVRGKWEY